MALTQMLAFPKLFLGSGWGLLSFPTSYMPTSFLMKILIPWLGYSQEL